MKLLRNFAAGLWLFAVFVQGLAHLTKYGLLPLPEAFGRLDFTPQYTVLVGLVIAAALAMRFAPAAKDEAVGKES